MFIYFSDRLFKHLETDYPKKCINRPNISAYWARMMRCLAYTYNFVHARRVMDERNRPKRVSRLNEFYSIDQANFTDTELFVGLWFIACARIFGSFSQNISYVHRHGIVCINIRSRIKCNDNKSNCSSISFVWADTRAQHFGNYHKNTSI